MRIHDATPTIVTEENRDDFFIEAASAGSNIFLTGMAGTGKTTLLRKFLEGFSGRVDITAPTGVAALNIGGTTIHRWCGMMLGPQGDTTNEAYFDWLKQQPYRSIRKGFDRVRDCQTLVIDEISMLPGRQVEFIEWLFRTIRRNPEPWGGAQVIVVGDFLQLPPVRKGGENVPYDWAFAHPVWARSQFVPVSLTRIWRQSDGRFIRALKAVRGGTLDGDEVSRGILKARVIPFPDSKIPHLYTHNTMVDRRNNSMLAELEGELSTFDGIHFGNPKNSAFIAENLMCPARLELKVGAVVMTTINHTDGDYVNGSIGTVVEIETCGGFMSTVYIKKTRDNQTVAVRPYTWKHGQNAADDGYAEYTQFPIRLAYAMTIHKCQGLTLNAAYIDVRAAREHGQAYVALSRVRELDGLLLKEWFSGVYLDDAVVQFHRDLNIA